MDDMMTFPDTLEEFMNQYKVIDTDGIYMSKGSELVPIFRIKQWCDHIFTMAQSEPYQDTISRADALSCFHDWIDQRGDVHTADEMPEFQRIEQLPSAQPELIEQGAYVRGFEQGRTQGMIDSQGGKK